MITRNKGRTFKTKDDVEYEWDSISGKWMPVSPKGGDPMAYAKIPPPRWMNGSFYCHCTPPDSAKYLCSHLVAFYRECNDAERGPFRTKFTNDGVEEIVLQSRTPRVPIVGGVMYDFRAEVVPHWASPTHHIIRVWDELDLCDEMYMLPSDGLIKLVGQVCDTLRSTGEYAAAMVQLLNRKAIACPNPKHSRRHNVAMAQRIDSLARYRIDGPLTGQAIVNWNIDILEPVLDEIAIAEAFSLRIFNNCSACNAEVIDPLNIPNDLIPSV